MSYRARSVLVGSYRKILAGLGENQMREGLVKTPERAAAALQHLTRGYQLKVEEIVNDALFSSQATEMVLSRNIEFFSLCEHHLLPIIGKCSVAYLPNGKIIGLSKIPRIVEMFARRLQVQERLTQEIAECLMQITKSRGVGVVIEAQHLCMMARGVAQQQAMVTTSAMLGNFKDSASLRNELFLSLKS